MHMISKRDLSDAEMDTLTKSSSPTIVITANGEVQTHEEAIVYVKELGLFVKLILQQETPAVLSWEKLCEEHGYTFHWESGQNPHLIKEGNRIDCNFFNLRTIYVSRNINEFFLYCAFICLVTIFITAVNIGKQ